MAKSVFVVTEGDYDMRVVGAFTSLDAAKDYVLSGILVEALEDYDPYVFLNLEISEMVGDEMLERFQPSCQGYDFGVGKITNKRKFLESLDIQCVTQR